MHAFLARSSSSASVPWQAMSPVCACGVPALGVSQDYASDPHADSSLATETILFRRGPGGARRAWTFAAVDVGVVFEDMVRVQFYRADELGSSLRNRAATLAQASGPPVCVLAGCCARRLRRAWPASTRTSMAGLTLVRAPCCCRGGANSPAVIACKYGREWQAHVHADELDAWVLPQPPAGDIEVRHLDRAWPFLHNEQVNGV